MNKLMVLDTPWHYRKATYWDMPKCATCSHKDLTRYEFIADDQYHCETIHSNVTDSFGCVHHSEIEQPEKLSIQGE